MNTKIIAAFVLATVIAAPAFADNDTYYPDQPVAAAAQAAGLTRAQVRAELVQLEKAGYNAASDDTQYPQNLQTAEARIAVRDDLASSGARVVGGKSVSGTLASARPASHDGTASIYFGG
jgi:uncharacterized protein YgbK (DUF1537 family)